jgi:hypothetical protein
MVDALRLAMSELLLEVALNKPVLKSVDGAYGRNIFRRVAEANPP